MSLKIYQNLPLNLVAMILLDLFLDLLYSINVIKYCNNKLGILVLLYVVGISVLWENCIIVTCMVQVFFNAWISNDFRAFFYAFFREREEVFEMAKIFFDMDGTLTVWKDATIEEVSAPGFFRNSEPQVGVLEMVKVLIAEAKHEIYILSSTFQDDHSEAEKREWLHQHLPELADEHMLFVPYGKPKSEWLGDKCPTDVLVDDLSANLRNWHGVGVKIYNGVNGHYRTWRGFSIHSNMEAAIMKKQLLSAVV